MTRAHSPAELERIRQGLLSQRSPARRCITICSGTACRAYKSERVVAAFREEIRKQAMEGKIDLRRTGCHGFCEQGALVVVFPEETCYTHVQPEDAPEILRSVLAGKVVERLLYVDPVTGARIAREGDIPFYQHQQRLIFGPNRLIDPTSIEDYLCVGGYGALAKALFERSPAQVLDEVTKAGLRGRGGGGFPTGKKWSTVKKAPGEPKYVICNCDEGDPGAYMDRSTMEGNPHLVLEGMMIGAYAIGSREGYVYIRNEYPLAVENLTIAIARAREHGLLGRDILGSHFSFDARVNRGGGAFVCGESTALMASLEGKPGERFSSAKLAPVAQHSRRTGRTGLGPRSRGLGRSPSVEYSPRTAPRRLRWATAAGRCHFVASARSGCAGVSVSPLSCGRSPRLDVRELLQAQVVSGSDLSVEVSTVDVADLMSDVLACSSPGMLLLTGLASPQVMRTAVVADLCGVVLVRDKQPTPALYAQFDADVPLGRVHAGLERCGFDAVESISPACDSVTAATELHLAEYRGQRPVISSFCPTVVRLVQMKYPDLIDQLLSIVPPREIAAQQARARAAREQGVPEERVGVVYVTPCSAKMVSIESHPGMERSHLDAVVSIRDLYQPLVSTMARMDEQDEHPAACESATGLRWAYLGGLPKNLPAEHSLVVAGVQNVIRVLDDIEQGRLRRYAFVECHACPEGCVSGCLAVENSYVARAKSIRRMHQLQPLSSEDRARLVAQHGRERFAMKALPGALPLRPLDEDIALAITKMKERDRLVAALPGIDCGACGAPSCKAFAEDVVLGEADKSGCVFLWQQEFAERMQELAALVQMWRARGGART
ncbi:MAG: NAD(P)H-dependent oxidoreductase subunit E [Deltaproteobacteria bacterium]|nr:NAD(P)H-dependent oxidoreductase subunit E [Deltaproteobacteria bacterium]